MLNKYFIAFISILILKNTAISQCINTDNPLIKQNFEQLSWNTLEGLARTHPSSLFLLSAINEAQAVPISLLKAVDNKNDSDPLKVFFNANILQYKGADWATLTTPKVYQDIHNYFKLHLPKQNIIDYVASALEKHIYGLVLDEKFDEIRLTRPHIEKLLTSNYFNDEQKGYIGCESAGFYLLLNDFNEALKILDLSQENLEKAKSQFPDNLNIDYKLANVFYYKSIAGQYIRTPEEALQNAKKV